MKFKILIRGNNEGIKRNGFYILFCKTHHRLINSKAWWPRRRCARIISGSGVPQFWFIPFFVFSISLGEFLDRTGQEVENKEEGTHGQGTIDERRHQERQHDESDGKDEHRRWRIG